MDDLNALPDWIGVVCFGIGTYLLGIASAMIPTDRGGIEFPGHDTVLESAPLLPKGVAEQYRGKWIAIRNREVVVVADSLEELYGDGAETRDVIYWVPRSAYRF